MIMDKVCRNDRDEYYTPNYAIRPLLKYLKANSKIWCPFDTEQSGFVKLLREDGHEVINTHIIDGKDFFEIDVPKVDYIISNPPYSIKDKLLIRLFDIGIPFAMLLSLPGIFEGSTRFNLFKNNKFEIMYFSKRISYMTDYIERKLTANPPFSSVYICHNVLPRQIIFEEVDRRDI